MILVRRYRIAPQLLKKPVTLKLRVSLLYDVPELGHSFLSFPDFLWAHRSGNSSPLRPTRLLLSRFLARQHGSLP